MVFRGLWAALLVLGSTALASADPLIGSQTTITYPDTVNGGTITSTIPDTLVPAAVPTSFVFDSQNGVAFAVANVTATGNMFSQSQLATSNASGLYEAGSITVYRVDFTPTATGPLTITFHVLPQTLQVFSDILSLAQLQVNVFIGDTQLLNTNERLGGGGGGPNFWQADAYDFTVQYNAVAGQTFTLEYNIQTFVSAFFESPAAAIAGFQQSQALAQYGDPFDINNPPNPNGNNINIRFDAAVAEVPEPATWISLLVMGAAATLGGRLRRRAS